VTVYRVDLAGRRLTVEVDGDGVRVDGRRVEARLDDPGASPVRHLVRDGRSRAFVPIAGAGSGRWQVLIGADHFDIVALDERSHAIRALAGHGAAPAVAGALKAPMAGLVVRVLVREGDRVEVGAGLVVVEAMKMENELKAAAAGVVRRVLVEPGAGVEKGAVLVELEPSG
jgi:pyruvate carboxylase subunit B